MNSPGCRGGTPSRRRRPVSAQKLLVAPGGLRREELQLGQPRLRLVVKAHVVGEIRERVREFVVAVHKGIAADQRPVAGVQQCHQARRVAGDMIDHQVAPKVPCEELSGPRLA